MPDYHGKQPFNSELLPFLRALTGERIPYDGTERDTNFEDSELSAVLEIANQRLNYAAAVVWSMKASEYAALVDVDESGSSRRLSQKYRNAAQQAEFFREIAEKDEAAIHAAVRALPRPARWAQPADEKAPYPYDDQMQSEYVRLFPGHRFFPSIKR